MGRDRGGSEMPHEIERRIGKWSQDAVLLNHGSLDPIHPKRLQ